ncbi:Mobile element protein [Caenispirillum salinarum AK4]|uniref:Mobile element protein n=1 Tax=Caenispirillum salinarum AK4 TaxID=1238182 RepID=K9H937_9PROT|nr:hypothetical protein [Caenispirillum salinarum]EKV27098.1 Mobile element protein [Caenispirillum salinarum AK4]
MASVREGNEVVLKDGDEEVASVTPCGPKPEGGRRSTFGIYKGLIHSDDSILDPLPEEELRLWEGRS